MKANIVPLCHFYRRRYRVHADGRRIILIAVSATHWNSLFTGTLPLAVRKINLLCLKTNNVVLSHTALVRGCFCPAQEIEEVDIVLTALHPYDQVSSSTTTHLSSEILCQQLLPSLYKPRYHPHARALRFSNLQLQGNVIHSYRMRRRTEAAPELAVLFA